MRAYINIVGVGKRMTGVSKKNGRPYDFIPVCFTVDHPQFQGLRACYANVDSALLASYVPAVGDCVEAFLQENFKKNSMDILGIL